MHVVQDRDRWRAQVNTAMDIRVAFPWSGYLVGWSVGRCYVTTALIKVIKFGLVMVFYVS
jgi:hypothetical protein